MEKEINTQVAMLKQAGTTPKRPSPIQPPKEIVKAVEIAKAEADIIRRTPKALHRIQKSGKPITNPFLYTPVHATSAMNSALRSDFPKPLNIEDVNMDLEDSSSLALSPSNSSNHGTSSQSLFSSSYSSLQDGISIHVPSSSTGASTTDIATAANNINSHSAGNSATNDSATHDNNRNDNSSVNGFSMGRSLPGGVSWRYVDVFSNPGLLK